MLSDLANQILPSPTVTLDTKVKTMFSEGISVINLSVGEPDFATPKNIQDAGIKALYNGFTHYTQVAGVPELRNALVQKFKKENNISYKQDEIIIGLGSKLLIYLAFKSILNKGDEVIVPTPTWNSFVEQIKICSGKPILLPLNSPFKLTAKDIESKITNNTKILLLNSPSNPTGAVIELAELEKIANLAIKNNLYIISDEIYEKLIYEGAHISIASLNEKIRERTITINGFSKSYAMTGWRIGYAGGPKDLISAMIRFQGQIASSAVSFVQLAALEAVTGDQKSIKEMFLEFKKRREYVFEQLSTIKEFDVIKPEGAFYFFVSIEKLIGNKYKSSIDWCEKLLLNEKIAVVPGEAFLKPNYFRLSFAASKTDLTNAIKGIKKFI